MPVTLTIVYRYENMRAVSCYIILFLQIMIAINKNISIIMNGVTTIKQTLKTLKAVNARYILGKDTFDVTMRFVIGIINKFLET